MPVSYKRELMNGLRETFGLIGVPIRLSMRSGGENPYAPKKRRGEGFWRNPRSPRPLPGERASDLTETRLRFILRLNGLRQEVTP